MNTEPFIHWEIIGNTGIITLNNPPRNEMQVPDFLSPSQILEWASITQIKGIIIKGKGRHFSSGACMDQLYLMAEEKKFLFEKINAGKELLSAINDLEIPVVAEISGVCFGGGLELTLACHLRVCSEQALFSFPEINHDLIPGLGGTVRLSEIIGQSRALSCLLSGDTFNAETALRYGLVDHVWERKSLPESTLSFMKRLTDNKPKKVIQTLMKSWHNSRKMSFTEAMAAETALFCEIAADEAARRKKI